MLFIGLGTILETLVKHLSSGNPELVQASLYHLALVLKRKKSLAHENTSYIAPLLTRPNDALSIKIQKVAILSGIATTVNASLTNNILDHLCQLSIMQDAYALLKLTEGRMDRALQDGYHKVALRCIAAIGHVGSGYRSTQLRLRTEGTGDSLIIDSDSNDTAAKDQAVLLESCQQVEKSCLDRLFLLLGAFSGVEHDAVSRQTGEEEKSKRRSAHSGSWPVNVPVAELGLEDHHIAALISSILMAIEGKFFCCWHYRRECMAQGQLPQGPILDAHQTKTLGLLLLRHLDQDELDRMAKKKNKPLRFKYDDSLGASGGYSSVSPGNSSTTSLDSSIILATQRQQVQDELQSGTLSRLARISGIQLLLLEESMQQSLLHRQIASLQTLYSTKDPCKPDLDSTTSTTTTSTASCLDSTPKKMESAKAALAMRANYTLLLQQQIQELGQTISPVQSDSLRARAEQLSLLYLACHLVAFSIIHGHDSDIDTSNNKKQDENANSSCNSWTNKSNRSVYVQRLEILAQVIDELVVSAERTGGHKEQGDDNPVAGESKGSMTTTVVGVAKDVADRARLINAMFLRPLVTVAGLVDQPPDSPLSTRQIQDEAKPGEQRRLDSRLFKSERYLQTVKQRFTAQFGSLCSIAAHDMNSSSGIARQHCLDLNETERQDWFYEIGFNTLAAVQISTPV
ncbi:hypothetical protein BGZ94_004154 [Podila epigama]|nr:hypothetical protein BGZ94_004154 [Podila epigama]